MEPILQNVSIIWSPFLYFNFKSFVEPSSLLFITFQCILDELGVLFWESWNFYKLKRWDLISWWNQFCRMTKLFGPLSCISIVKVFYTQILRHSLHFNAFCMIQEYFSQRLWISSNQRGVPNFWGKPILRNVWIIWFPRFYFNLNSSMDTNFLSFIKFQSLLYESGVLFSESENIYKLKRGDLISGRNQFLRMS